MRFPSSPLKQANELNILQYTDKVSTPILWLGSEIAISIISVSLPSIFFLAQHAHRNGIGALITTQSYLSRSRLPSSHNRFHRDDSAELVSQSLESLHSSTRNISNANPYLTSTKTTAQFGGTDVSIEHTQHSGIYVRNDIVVV